MTVVFPVMDMYMMNGILLIRMSKGGPLQFVWITEGLTVFQNGRLSGFWLSLKLIIWKNMYGIF